MRRASSPSLAYLAGLVLLLALLLLVLWGLQEDRARFEPSRSPSPSPLPSYVIEPGQEETIQELLAPIDEGAVPGVEQFSFSVEGGELAVQLFDADSHRDEACPGPAWVRTPGAMFIYRGEPAPDAEDAASQAKATSLRSGMLRARVYWCGDSPPLPALRVLLTDLEDGDIDRVWTSVEVAPGGPSGPRLSGLLRPAGVATGLDLRSLAQVLLLGLGLGAIGLGMGLGPWLPGPLPGPASEADTRRRGWMIGGFLGAVVWRLWILGQSTADGDESWGAPLSHSIFDETHDAWVHPPLFHLVQQPWVRAIGWSPDQGLGLLRAPMLLAGVLALAILVIAMARRATPPAALLLALPCLFAPRFALASQLARPYPLAALLVTIVAVCLWAAPAEGAEESPGAARLRWSLILLAAGLATWTDILAGAVAGVLVFVRVLEASADRRAYLSGALACVLLVLVVVPFVPGILETLEHQIDPDITPEQLEALGILRPGDVMPSPRLTRQIPAFATLGIAAPLVPLGLVCLGLLAALAAWGRGMPDRWGALLLPVVLVLVALFVASTTVHLRPRNLLFAPILAAWFATLGIEGRWRQDGRA